VITVDAADGAPEVGPGTDLAALVVKLFDLADGDVVAVTSKVVSKAEDRVRPGTREEALETESRRVVARRGPTAIVRTRHGLTLAAAGIDASNVAPGTVVLLPEDPDASATRLRERLRELTGADVGVIVSDSFGRAWRQGATDVAIGLAGIRPLLDLTGTRDATGYELHATVIAVADELAGAAQLVLGKTDGVPAAVIRGVDARGEGTARELVMPADRDLFR
jgi:coenzyme F420-0:L-glutamate ligase/coenzyme F420-1:gamma-L-glutamate ligase